MATNRQAASSSPWRAPIVFAILAILFVLEGTVRNSMFSGSWNTSLAILNMGLISAITALGVNMQWGYAGLFNVGVVGFLAMGALAPVLIPTFESLQAISLTPQLDTPIVANSNP